MDSVFFFASKIVWALITPGSLLVILGMAAWLSLFVGWQKMSRFFLSLTALFLLLLGTLPLGEWLISPLENRFAANAALPMSPTGVIVLGGAVNPALSDTWGQTEIGGAAERLTAFVYLANLYPDTQLVFTGGSGSITEQAYKKHTIPGFCLSNWIWGNTQLSMRANHAIRQRTRYTAKRC
jgi:uncharacterized SAM-binding protein YcdF (DUF218 family)